MSALNPLMRIGDQVGEALRLHLSSSKAEARSAARESLDLVGLTGEPFQLFFTPAEVARELARFTRLEDLGSTEINARYFNGRTDQLAVRGSGGRLVSAWK